MFERRRREDADGERRIIGSGRRVDTLEEGDLGRETSCACCCCCCCWWEEEEGGWEVEEWGWGFEGRERERNVSAILRTWEKSVGFIPRKTVLRSPILLSPL